MAELLTKLAYEKNYRQAHKTYVIINLKRMRMVGVMKREELKKYHTYAFLKKRKNDPAWRESYLDARYRLIRNRLLSLIGFSVLLISCLYLSGNNFLTKRLDTFLTDKIPDSASKTDLENVASSTNDNSEAFPYAVSVADINNLHSFHYTGINNPATATLLFSNEKTGTITFEFSDPTRKQVEIIEFTTEYQLIPTKEIRIFTADYGTENKLGLVKNRIRTVRVNSEILLTTINKADRDREKYFDGKSLYFFHNKSGGISLVTPNYAGNVSESETDVMQEVLNN